MAHPPRRPCPAGTRSQRARAPRAGASTSPSAAHSKATLLLRRGGCALAAKASGRGAREGQRLVPGGKSARRRARRRDAISKTSKASRLRSGGDEREEPPHFNKRGRRRGRGPRARPAGRISAGRSNTAKSRHRRTPANGAQRRRQDRGTQPAPRPQPGAASTARSPRPRDSTWPRRALAVLRAAQGLPDQQIGVPRPAAVPRVRPPVRRPALRQRPPQIVLGRRGRPRRAPRGSAASRSPRERSRFRVALAGRRAGVSLRGYHMSGAPRHRAMLSVICSSMTGGSNTTETSSLDDFHAEQNLAERRRQRDVRRRSKHRSRGAVSRVAGARTRASCCAPGRATRPVAARRRDEKR